MGLNEIIVEMQERALDKSRGDVILFASIFEFKKYRINYPNDWQDMNEHWDVLITKIYEDNMFNSFRIDVKGNKKGYREHDSILLELRNVKGKKGWMYGRAHGMAFERENDFMYVKRGSLLNLIQEKVHNWNHDKQDVIDWNLVIKNTVQDPSKVHYKLVNRYESNRNDIFTYVPYSDIEPLIRSIIPKDPTKNFINFNHEKISSI